MTALTTILIWLGSGFAFAVGAFTGAWLMMLPNKQGREAAIAANEHAKESLVELRKRNLIGLRQVDALEQLVGLLTEAMDNADDDDPADVASSDVNGGSENDLPKR